SDRDFRHVAGRQERLEFAIRKLFKHLHGRDEIVHEHDCPNREKGTQDRKGDFFIHWHRDEFLSLSRLKEEPSILTCRDFLGSLLKGRESEIRRIIMDIRKPSHSVLIGTRYP